jgi:fructose-1,6-bisphosphatase I
MLHRREHVGEENPSDEKQLEADVWANELLKEKITSIDGVGEFASEEEHEVTRCGEGYSVAVDPLDGSSNIPTNNLVGTIVGVYDAELPARGTEMVSAFYVVFGPLTTAVFSDGETVNEYVVEERPQDEVEVHLVGEDLSLPEPRIYGFGGNLGWTEEFRQHAREVEERLKLRYGGSLVGDINQVIHHGGVFGYPAKQGAPEGKLRLQFEANPVSFIVESLEAGASSDGTRPVLEKRPENLHERTPLFAGREEEIGRLPQLKGGQETSGGDKLR